MKKCPTCDRTFADGMKYCQTDGTLLVDDAPPADPYKTVIGNQNDIAAAIPPHDPFKTVIASQPPRAKEEDVLQLPDNPDAQKTILVPQGESREELKSGRAEDVPALDLPPAPSAPLIEPKLASQTDYSAPAQFNKPALSPPVFENLSSSETSSSDATTKINQGFSQENASSSPFDSKPFPNDFSAQSPYGNQDNKPIPSPFQNPMPPQYQPPAASPFDPPKPPIKEAEPRFGGQPESFGQSPFQPPSPFGSAEQPFNSPIQQAEWNPPPAPVAEWQNQEMNANTPFQPPLAGQGQNQTLPIISLTLGILSVCCYVSPLTGIAAVVTGFLGMKNANSNPAQYGGKTMAIVGMVLGGLFFLIGIIYYIFVLIVGFSGFIPN